MTLPASGKINFNDLNGEFGQVSGSSYSLQEYASGSVDILNPENDLTDIETQPYSLSDWYLYDHDAVKQEPTVTMIQSAITHDASIDLRMRVDSIGEDLLSSWGVFWGLDSAGDPYPGGTYEEFGHTPPSTPAMAPNENSGSVTGLSTGTAYRFQAAAMNSYGTGSSYNSATFVTTDPANTPNVETGIASSITSTSANHSGDIISNNGFTITEMGVVYDTNYGPTTSDSKQTATTIQTGSFSTGLSGLNSNERYYVRAYAINSNGTSYGINVSFTTTGGGSTIPTVITTVASNITTGSAQSGGEVIDDGGATVTARGVTWNDSGTPTVGVDSSTNDGTGEGSYSSALTNLLASTTYYYRAYATNSNGISYGLQFSFNTSAGSTIPSVTTGTPVTIGETTCKFIGDLTSLGSDPITDLGWYYKLNTAGDPFPSGTKEQWGTGILYPDEPSGFIKWITGLSVGTGYKVQAYATNAVGTAVGSVIIFTTVTP